MRPLIVTIALAMGFVAVSLAQPVNGLDVGSAARTAHDTSLYKWKADWKRVVDEYWGPGLPKAQKQQVFDTFADYIHDRFPCFDGLNADWDSLRSFHEQQITDSTSRGAFSALLSRLAHDMHEFHVMGWDSVLFSTPMDAGTPVFAVGMVDIRHFGAVLAPLPDSTLLVLRAVGGHPLGLRPGDVILGYEGVPWKQLAFELLASPLPRRGPLGSSPSARTHMLLVAAGMNWHLFDTLDVIRHASGLVEHVPTAPMAALDIEDFMVNNEQLPVPSVPQPNYDLRDETCNVSYGIVGGTNIGYIYINGHSYRGVREEFRSAVAALMGTDGLIIDIRYNHGGSVLAGPEAGLGVLLNVSTQTLIGFERSSQSDLYALRPTPHDMLPFFVQADPQTLYDRPIAVLVGPYAWSCGDFTANKFRFLPGARFFGQPANGAATGMIFYEPVVSGFHFMVPFFLVADYRDPGVMLARREFPIDEAVWFDKDDVAQGEDTVVKRALAWITGLSHAHDLTVSSVTLAPGADTVRLSAVVENPNGHPLSVIAYVTDSTTVDSAAFADDGMHSDGQAGDGRWGAEWRAPAREGFWFVTLTTRDQIAGTSFSMPFSARMTTAGPLVVDTVRLNVSSVRPGRNAIVSVRLRNTGVEAAIPQVTALLTSADTCCLVGSMIRTLGEVPAGDTSRTSAMWGFSVPASCPGGHTVTMMLSLMSGGIMYWADSITLFVDPVVSVESDLAAVPASTYLAQNYPNPFNPTTEIRFAVAEAGWVTLKVYDLLGREVAVLVDGPCGPGSHAARFDARSLPSGVYLCRLTAGTTGCVRKMVLAR